MKAFGKILLALGFVTLISGAAAYLLSHQFLRVDEIQIQEGRTDSPSPLFALIQVDLKKQLMKFSQQTIFEISLDEIMKLIESDKRVEKASVRRQFPNHVYVEIIPRQPLLLLLGLSGQLYPVATDASLLPPLPVATSPDLPILRGLDFFDDENLRKKIVGYMEIIPRSGLFSHSSISEVKLDREKDLVFFLSESGMEVLVGSELDQSQIRRIEQVLKYLTNHKIKGRVIDARFSKKVVVRVRNAS